VISALIFIGVISLLIMEGHLLTTCALGMRDKRITLSCGLAMAALSNVLLVWLFTVLRIPLIAATLLPAHVLVMLLAYRLQWSMRSEGALPSPTLSFLSSLRSPLVIVSTALLTVAVIYGVSHSVLLPTFQYDSATNWTMRSEISFYDEAIAFDREETRGMAKPQYPVLFHMLQLTASLGQPAWNDTAANTVLELLSIGTFAGVYFILRRRRSSGQSLLTIALIAGIPLVGVHLGQGYGDLNLLQYLLLSLVCLAESADTGIDGHLPRSRRWLWLSAVFILAAVWTKSEGWFFGLLPWTLLLAFHAWRQPHLRRTTAMALVGVVILSLPWYVLLHTQQLNLTPHGTDTMFKFHAEGVPEVLHGLFTRGSFGPLWYCLPIVTALIVILARKRDPLIKRRHVASMIWGWLVFLEVLFIYLCTPNIVFLMNAESFYRQMMIPGALIILGCSLCIDWKQKMATAA
jgi:hypothetical protein